MSVCSCYKFHALCNPKRYKTIPDSSGAPHHRGQQDSGYLQMPTQSGDHRRSQPVPPEYRQQQAYERERQEKEMKEREREASKFHW